MNTLNAHWNTFITWLNTQVYEPEDGEAISELINDYVQDMDDQTKNEVIDASGVDEIFA